MTMMSQQEELLREIREFCVATGMAETTFGQRAIRSWTLVQRLDAGASVTLKTADRIRKFMSENRAAPTHRRVA